jgi:hypothetical protein
LEAQSHRQIQWPSQAAKPDFTAAVSRAALLLGLPRATGGALLRRTGGVLLRQLGRSAEDGQREAPRSGQGATSATLRRSATARPSAPMQSATAVRPLRASDRAPQQPAASQGATARRRAVLQSGGEGGGSAPSRAAHGGVLQRRGQGAKARRCAVQPRIALAPFGPLLAPFGPLWAPSRAAHGGGGGGVLQPRGPGADPRGCPGPPPVSLFWPLLAPLGLFSRAARRVASAAQGAAWALRGVA